MKARAGKKENGSSIRLDMVKFADVCENAINEACISGFEKGWTPIKMCEFELRLWGAANIIGNRLFACEPKVDFSDGRMDKVKRELEEGIWSPAEVAHED